MSSEQPANNNGKHRIVVLCGPGLSHRNTCATLIRQGLHVAGICAADQRKAGLPLPYLLRSVKRKGFWPTLSRSLARLIYQCRNSRRDRAAMARIFDEKAISETLLKWGGPVHHTASYSDPKTIAWLKELKPDIFVVHTSYWVGKKVRNLPSTKIVLGGHPGLTPYYRGSHSAFWAVYFGKPQDVGCTVFLLDEGVDTGEIVVQERIPIAAGDSFVTLAWKGMKRIAELQAAVLSDLDQGIELPRKRLPAPENSEFDNPTLGEFFQYCLRQRQVR